MSLLTDVISEMGGGCGGATGAGAIGGARGMLFGGANTSSRKKKKTSMIQRRVPSYESASRFTHYTKTLTKEGSLNKGGILNLSKVREKGQSQLQYAMSLISEDITGATDFDAADVVSKLEAAEKKAKIEKDTMTFGLKNEDGRIVQVYVRKDQAEEFEQALSQMLAGSDNNHDKENSALEIAEVLFKLKDRYDIVDVDWGDIEEDEEQEQTVGNEQGAEGQPGAEGGAGGENPIDQEAGAEGGEPGAEGGEEGGMEMGGEEGGGEEQAKSALDAVIDMMKADAKAKQAEAEARAAEARAKEAEWTAKASASKVKQEEEVLDMETHEKEIQKQEKEAKRLAKLAKYRHDKASKYSGELHGSPDQTMSDDQLGQANAEEEESGGAHIPYDDRLKYKGGPERVSLEQLRDMIFYHLKGDTT